MLQKSIARTGAESEVFSGDFRGSQGPQGGGPSNTHLANRQGVLPRETGGEDTLVLSLGVNWGVGFVGLVSRLLAWKEQAKESHGPVVASLGDRLFLVRPSGSSSGGGHGVHYAFVLETAGYVLKIAGQAEPCKETPNVIVEVGSLELMTGGGVCGAWDQVKRIVEALGGVLVFDKVSRVDLCVDLPGVDVADFYNLIDGEQYACRARKQDFHKDGMRKTGVTLGAGGVVVCRIYDKVYEVTEAHPDPSKREVLEERRWGGPQDKAARVEFQLRRDALKTFGVDGVADYLRLRSGICEYLVDKWLRLLDEKPDRENNNTQRTAPHLVWLEVARAFHAWVGNAGSAVRRVSGLVYGDPVRLVKQAAGCLMAAVAEAKNGALISSRDFLQSAGKCMDFVVATYGDLGFYDRYGRKAARVSVLARA